MFYKILEITRIWLGHDTRFHLSFSNWTFMRWSRFFYSLFIKILWFERHWTGARESQGKRTIFLRTPWIINDNNLWFSSVAGIGNTISIHRNPMLSIEAVIKAYTYCNLVFYFTKLIKSRCQQHCNRIKECSRKWLRELIKLATRRKIYKRYLLTF